MAEENPVMIDPDSKTSFSITEFYKKISARLTTPAKALIALVVIVGLVFAGRAIHHSIVTHHQAGNSKKTISQNNPRQQSQKNTGNQASGSNSGSAQSSGSSSAGSTTPTQVPNTGPGDVAAIFAGTSAAAAGAHFVYSRRQRRA